MNQKAWEVNFDGIVGPTHNYSGLSYGNLASESNQFKASNPREAALQGLKKMNFLHKKGIKQAVIPPQERPFIPILKHLGYAGSDREIIATVHNQNPALLLSVCSAASMWTANAATVSPSFDSRDKRLHLTSANLTSHFHRSIESATTSKILKKIFKSSKHFIHHDSLPSSSFFFDEGAANHTRFCHSHGKPGVQLFVFGKHIFQPNSRLPKKYSARQTIEASAAITRLHALDAGQIIFVQQHPNAIDAGAFHNDVVSVGNENVFLFHEQAFMEKKKLLHEIKTKVSSECETDMIFLEVRKNEVSLKEAIASYLFNSQLISNVKTKNGKKEMILLAPLECLENLKLKAYIDGLIAAEDNPIQEVAYLNLKQSMRNGGGPACLRLRIVLSDEELKSAHQGVFFSDDLNLKLVTWVKRHYRDRLEIKDLADPQLYEEGKTALDELTKILKLGTIYSFQ